MLSPTGDPVEPLVETLPAGSPLYQVHNTAYPAAASNPGIAPATPNARFSFFGNPPVPTLYAAETVDVAILDPT